MLMVVGLAAADEEELLLLPAGHIGQVIDLLAPFLFLGAHV